MATGGIIALFAFGYADDVIVRAVGALAAGGLAGWLSGKVIVGWRGNAEDGPGYRVRATGGFAVFLVLMFAEDIKTLKDVALGIPPAPHVPRTVSLSKSQLLYQAEIAAAQFEVSQGNYLGGLDILTRAVERHPHEPLALHMLGGVYFALGRYAQAVDAFAKGFAKGGPGAGRFAYNAALGSDAMYSPGAKTWIDRARDAQSEAPKDYPHLWKDIVHFRGVTYVFEGLPLPRSARNEAFREAAASFQQFKDADGRPIVWVEYNLACMHAVNADEDGYPSLSQDRAVEHFRRFLEALPMMSERELKGSLDVAQRILMDPAPSAIRAKRGPGESHDCPVLKKIWERAGNSWTQVERAIRRAKASVDEELPEAQKTPYQISFPDFDFASR